MTRPVAAHTVAARSVHARLLRALVARELHPARVAVVAPLVVVAAALLGRQIAGQTLPAGVDVPASVGAPEAFGAYLLARVGDVLAVPFGVAAAALAVARVAGDHEDGWLPALAAAGPGSVRAGYLLGVVLATVAAVALHSSLASLAFALAGGVALTDALPRTAAALPGAAAFALSAAAYGAAWGALLRRRGAASVAAVAGVVLPIAAATAWRVATGGPPPDAVARLLALPIPPLAWDGIDAVSRHAPYAAAVLVPLTLLAPRLVARTR